MFLFTLQRNLCEENIDIFAYVIDDVTEKYEAEVLWLLLNFLFSNFFQFYNMFLVYIAFYWCIVFFYKTYTRPTTYISFAHVTLRIKIYSDTYMCEIPAESFSAYNLSKKGCCTKSNCNQLLQLCTARTAWTRLCGPCIAAIAGD